MNKVNYQFFLRKLSQLASIHCFESCYSITCICILYYLYLCVLCIWCRHRRCRRHLLSIITSTSHHHLNHLQVQQQLQFPSQQPVIRHLKIRAVQILQYVYIVEPLLKDDTIRSPCCYNDILGVSVFHFQLNGFLEHYYNRILDGGLNQMVGGCYDHSKDHDQVDRIDTPYFREGMPQVSPDRFRQINCEILEMI